MGKAADALEQATELAALSCPLQALKFANILHGAPAHGPIRSWKICIRPRHRGACTDRHAAGGTAPRLSEQASPDHRALYAGLAERRPRALAGAAAARQA